MLPGKEPASPKRGDALACVSVINTTVKDYPVKSASVANWERDVQNCVIKR